MKLHVHGDNGKAIGSKVEFINYLKCNFWIDCMCYWCCNFGQNEVKQSKV